MMFDSSDSRRAAEFDSYRRELVLHSRTVSGEAREAWFEKLKELVTALFPDAECNARKPGLATRLYSLEVSLPHRDKMHLLDLATELDDNWRAMIKSEVKGGASCVYRDRMDAIWEWVVDLGDCFVTGHVKLRNFNFDHISNPRERSDGDRPERRPYNDRPNYGGGERKPYQDRKPYGDRPGGDRPYQDRKPYGDRPGGDRPYQDRKPYGDRPSGDRPYQKPFGDRKPYSGGGGGGGSTYGRPQGPSGGPPGSPRPPFGRGPSGPNKGYPKFGGSKKGPGRPKRKWPDG